LERKVIVVVGPTASGKTFLSLELARRLRSEIVSADSRQVYKHLDIGTAKPEKKYLNEIEHHFINLLEPDAEFNASDFEIEAIKILNSLSDHGIVPIVVGGSGLYIKALIDGIFNVVGTDEDYRLELSELRKKFGNQYLYEELRKVDPEAARSMLPSNWKRVMRALEVFHISGEPISQLQKDYEREVELKFYQFGLEWDRDALYEIIERRVDNMIELGLVEEVRKLLEMGYAKKINALNTVGYKEIIAYLEDEYDLERAVYLIKRNSRRYAKRQITWFRKDSRIEWIRISGFDDLLSAAKKIIKSIQ
jgi:tRNA dimethylallyltransferase